MERLMMITILHGDALNLMSNLKEESVDLVLTDPQYNISKPNNFHTMETGSRNIDFGDWDGEFDQLTWINMVSPLVKKGGSIVIFNTLENMGDIKDRLESNGFVFKDRKSTRLNSS